MLSALLPPAAGNGLFIATEFLVVCAKPAFKPVSSNSILTDCILLILLALTLLPTPPPYL